MHQKLFSYLAGMGGSRIRCSHTSVVVYLLILVHRGAFVVSDTEPIKSFDIRGRLIRRWTTCLDGASRVVFRISYTYTQWAALKAGELWTTDMEDVGKQNLELTNILNKRAQKDEGVMPNALKAERTWQNCVWDADKEIELKASRR